MAAVGETMKLCAGHGIQYTVAAFDRVPVVILTSSREEKDLVESYKHGVNAYVVKPVDFQQFIHAVKDLGAFWAVINEPPPGSVRKMK